MLIKSYFERQDNVTANRSVKLGEGITPYGRSQKDYQIN
jgi:hypothetical protein